MLKIPDNPYPGLRSFQHKERFLFFGREDHSKALLEKLENRFVAVVGTSGSGKSSLVQAGLLPSLHRGLNKIGARWKISICRPGDNPIHQLAESLCRPENFGEETEDDEYFIPPDLKLMMVEPNLRQSAIGLTNFAFANLADEENLLVVVDQFEELFRFKEESERQSAGDEAAAFVKLLLEATKEENSRVFVIITMRSDFLGHCSQFRGLPEAINDGQYLIPRLNWDELTRAIASPAKVCSAQISDSLTNRLLNDLGDDQDQLPVLQHALMRTWEHWKVNRNSPEDPIGVEHYEAVGGWKDTLSNHANEAYGKLTKEQQSIAKKLFRCLTEKDSENREKRRPTSVEKIYAIVGAETEEAKKNVDTVINVFRQQGRTFLMPPMTVQSDDKKTINKEVPGIDSKTVIDISHESLIRNWDRLKIWATLEAKDAETYRRLANQSLKYEERGQNTDYLLRGLALEEAIEWYERFEPNAAWTSRYQILSESDKDELAEILRDAPGDVQKKLEEIIARRFTETIAFLEASKTNEEILRQEAEEFERLKIKQPFTRKLRWAAIGLSILLVATLVAVGLALVQNSKLKEVNQELTKQKETIDVQFQELQKQQKVIDDLYEKERENFNKRQEELKENNEELKKSKDAADEQRKRADAERLLAKLNEDKAKTAEAQANGKAKELSIANDEIQAQIAILDLNRQGSVFVENTEYEEAAVKFNEYLKCLNSSCRPSKEGNNERKKMIGEWWGNHNLALVNWQLGKFSDAESNFEKALSILGYKKSLANNNPLRTSPVSFVSTNYDLFTNDEEISKGIIITLRKFAKFYHDLAVTTLHKDKLLVCNNKQITDQRDCFNDNARVLYESLDKEPIHNNLLKANIRKELGDVYYDLKRYSDAFNNYDLSLKTYLQERPEPAFIISGRKDKLKALLQLNEFDKAEEETKEIIRLKDAISGTDYLYDLQVAENYEDLSILYKNYQQVLDKIYKDKVTELKIDPQNKDIKDFLDELDDEDLLTFDPFVTRPDNPKGQIIWDKFKEMSDLYTKIAYKSSRLFTIAQKIKEFNNKTNDPTTGYYELAEAYFNIGQFCHSQEVFKQGYRKLQDISDNKQMSKIRYLFVIADFYRKNFPDTNKAIEYYTELMNDLDKLDTNFITQLELQEKTYLTSIYYKTGMFFEAQRLYPEARLMLDKHSALVEQSPAAYFTTRIEIGQVFEMENKKSEAIAEYENLLKYIYDKNQKDSVTRNSSNTVSNSSNVKRNTNTAVNTFIPNDKSSSDVSEISYLQFYEELIQLKLLNIYLKSDNKKTDAERILKENLKKFSSARYRMNISTPSLLEKYILITKEIGNSLKDNQEYRQQAILNYLNSALATKAFRNERFYFRVVDYDAGYLESRRLTAKFYNDYIDTLNILKSFNEPIESFDKIEELEKAKNQTLEVLVENTPKAVCQK